MRIILILRGAMPLEEETASQYRIEEMRFEPKVERPIGRSAEIRKCDPDVCREQWNPKSLVPRNAARRLFDRLTNTTIAETPKSRANNFVSSHPRKHAAVKAATRRVLNDEVAVVRNRQRFWR